MNSQLSLARFSGGCTINGHTYHIIQLPDQPADLCRQDWVKPYRTLGRTQILDLVHQGKTLPEIKQHIKELKNNALNPQNKETPQTPDDRDRART